MGSSILLLIVVQQLVLIFEPVNPKGNQPWIFIERTDAEAEAPILWPPDSKSWLTGRDPVAGKDWRQEEKGTTEDEIVGWHHWLNGHEFEEAPGEGERQRSLACCSPWGLKKSDMTEWLNNCFFTSISLRSRLFRVSYLLDQRCTFLYISHVWNCESYYTWWGLIISAVLKTVRISLSFTAQLSSEIVPISDGLFGSWWPPSVSVNTH